MTRKRYITLIVGIAALVLGAESALARPLEATARQDQDRAAFVRAARFFKESQRITPTVSENLSVGQETDRAAFVRAARFFKESQRITPTAGSPRQADFWNYDSGVKVADASPGVLPRDLAALYGGSDGTLGDGPQLADRNTTPEVGIGLGIGIVFAFGLVLILRVAHVRPFAH